MPAWTKQDEMARKIQTLYRQYRYDIRKLKISIASYILYRAKKMLLQLKKKKEEYDVLMDKLQREV